MAALQSTPIYDPPCRARLQHALIDFPRTLAAVQADTDGTVELVELPPAPHFDEALEATRLRAMRGGVEEWTAVGDGAFVFDGTASTSELAAGAAARGARAESSVNYVAQWLDGAAREELCGFLAPSAKDVTLRVFSCTLPAVGTATALRAPGARSTVGGENSRALLEQMPTAAECDVRAGVAPLDKTAGGPSLTTILRDFNRIEEEIFGKVAQYREVPATAHAAEAEMCCIALVGERSRCVVLTGVIAV